MEYQIFEAMNGIAGKNDWFDLLVCGLVSYGLLFTLLILLALYWWPYSSAQMRRRQIIASFLAVSCCVILFFVEWWLIIRHVLPNELRARPDNVLWVNLLFIPDSRMAFPAWPVLTITALAFSLIPFTRIVAGCMALVALLTGISLVISGINYPFDVISGMVSGAAIGITCAYAAKYTLPNENNLRLKSNMILLWLGFVCWFVVMAVTIKPANYLEPQPQKRIKAEKLLMVAPPEKLTSQLAEFTGCEKITIQAATNGYLTNAILVMMISDKDLNQRRVYEVIRMGINTIYAQWPALDLVTIDVSMPVAHAHREILGTLCRVTISRSQWPCFRL